MRKRTAFIIAASVLTAVIVPPWLAAYRSDQGVRYSYGRLGDHQLECVAVDGTHFDRYFSLVFESSAGSRVNYGDGRILLDGRPIEFPSGQNAGVLRPDGQIQYMTVTEGDIASDSSGNSAVYYIFGKVPKLKHFPFGVPSAPFVERTWSNVK